MLTFGRVRVVVAAVTIAGAVASSSAVAGQERHPTRGETRHEIAMELAQDDAANLTNAAEQIEAEALKTGALKTVPGFRAPAKILMASVDALITAARHADPSRQPQDTRSIMGPVPLTLQHRLKHHQHHDAIKRTRSMRLFSHPIWDRGSWGVGLKQRESGNLPAPFLRHDGLFVDPWVQPSVTPTISEVALRAAIRKLGQPYVWAAAGPTTFDCSGLVKWAYAHAGIKLIHYSGDQWNEGRLIPPMDILPGDLILFGDPTHHVAMYLGASWMINAPYTGQWVDIVPVESGVAGVVRL